MATRIIRIQKESRIKKKKILENHEYTNSFYREFDSIIEALEDLKDGVKTDKLIHDEDKKILIDKFSKAKDIIIDINDELFDYGLLVESKKKLKESAYKGINVSPFKPFTKEDYYAYAGAEKFSNGDEPLIYEVELQDHDIVFIIDSTGAEINIDYDNSYLLDNNSFVKCLRACKNVIQKFSEDMDLLDFYEVIETEGFIEI